jgi:biofilm PGA synthesis N-glycosyltransferase PgaC
MLIGAIYPPLFWLVSAGAALRSQIPALFRGPRERRVVWDIPRERLGSG